MSRAARIALLVLFTLVVGTAAVAYPLFDGWASRGNTRSSSSCSRSCPWFSGAAPTARTIARPASGLAQWHR